MTIQQYEVSMLAWEYEKYILACRDLEVCY